MSFLFGYIATGSAPLRSEAKDSAEMVSQCLLGECFEVISISERWVNVRTLHDRYEGWVSRPQVQFLSDPEFRTWFSHPKKTRSPYKTFYAQFEQTVIQVPFGSEVVFHPNHLELPQGEFTPLSEPMYAKGDTLIETAKTFMGTPYLWGGRTDTGIDCSGFVQIVFNVHGYYPPRDSSVQAKLTTSKGNSILTSTVGDLLFFGEQEDKITHVGFHVEQGVVLHASGMVRMDNLIYEHRFDSPFKYNERLAKRLQKILPSSAFMIPSPPFTL